MFTPPHQSIHKVFFQYPKVYRVESRRMMRVFVRAFLLIFSVCFLRNQVNLRRLSLTLSNLDCCTGMLPMLPISLRQRRWKSIKKSDSEVDPHLLYEQSY